MNIFILNTGRCGSTTFIEACQHITNYTAAHESRTAEIGEERLDYPDNHIEADNRLSWFLGRLEEQYGDSAIYVHLYRKRTAVARSFANRYNKGIIRAYKDAILMDSPENMNPVEVSEDYVKTVNANIRLFLKDKSRKMSFALENAKSDFRKFWNLVGAEGDLDAALKEWDKEYNATENPTILELGARKMYRIVKKLPKFIKTA
jgi:hypothetical protein